MKNPDTKLSRASQICLASIATVVLLRLLSLPFPDLIDSTEGRYASVAKLMIARNDWVTPWINLHGVEQPYNGKPPLHFWLMQISFLILGFTNFAARLPGVVSSLGIALCLGLAARTLAGPVAGYIAALIFLSSTITFFLSGAAVLDMTLTFGITLALIGFLLCERSRLWGYMSFLGAAIGMLVKGPLAIVIPGLVVVPWAIVQRYRSGRWPRQFSDLPWVTGTLLFLAVAAPWYALAELKTPGFLEYFFVNENFGRYLRKDYGDQYGVGHRQPFGAVWAMMIPALIPWSFLLLAWLFIGRREIFSRSSLGRIADDSPLLFSVLWALSCPLLLTTARQYTGTYIVPSIPGFALMGALLCHSRIEPHEPARLFAIKGCRALSALMAVVVVIGSIIGAIRYDTPIILLPVCFGMAALFLFSLRVNVRDISLVKEIARVSICTAAMFALASFAWNNNLSNNRSTRRVLAVASSLAKPGAPELRIGFSLYFPFSATFFGPLETSPPLRILNVDEGEITGSNADLLVVRKRNEEKFLEVSPGREKLAQIGQWRIYRGSGGNAR